MSVPSLTSGTSLDTSLHDHGLEGYHHGESHEPVRDHDHDHDHDQGDTHHHHHHRNDNGDEPTYPCLFDILNCHQSFTNPEYWKTHVLSHFRTFDPPAIARCPFCPGSGSEPTSPVSSPRSQLAGSIGSVSVSVSVSESSSTDESTESTDRGEQRTTTFINTPHTRAWDALLDHLVSHYQQRDGHRSNHREPQKQRTDFELLRYLYTLRLITEDQWKAAVQLGVVPGSPSDRRGEQSVRQTVGRADEPFWGLFSPRRERRRQRHSPGRNSRSPGRGPGGPGGPRGPARIVLSSC